MNPRLQSAVSVVKISDDILEFFKSNTREQVRIHVKDNTIMNIVCGLDGKKTVNEIAAKYDISVQDVEALMAFLRSKGILANFEPSKDFEKYLYFRRPIHFLSDYSQNHDHLVKMWKNIRNATVLIIGLGAVGSWVAANLVQTGVKNLILMDPDKVELSNLHRQFGYTEDQIGKSKVEVMKNRLLDYADDLNIIISESFLGDNSLNEFDGYNIDLVINCADKPNVDTTSMIVGEYCMKRGIPHIVGGGYNLHLSLIGQTVIPGKTACVKCFQKQLEEENKIDKNKVKKLAVKNRKGGSFGPMCSIIASMIGMEAVKILSKSINPANINRRGELNIQTMEIAYKIYNRRSDCEWCGENGIYRS